MDALLTHLKNVRQLYTASESTSYLLTTIELGWAKLKNYNPLKEFNLVPYATVELYPSIKYA